MQVKVGKYDFVITETKTIYRGETTGFFFKIGGNIDDCVNISVEIKNNVAISASMPHAMYDEQCSLNMPLERGDGSIIMIKTLLLHIKRMFPELKYVKFDDMSAIECATEEDIRKNSRMRKTGTNLVPMPLYYLSIAYNGETWYEKYLKAVQEDIVKHVAYKKKVYKMLHDPTEKPDFIHFLRLTRVPMNNVEELEGYYLKSSTYHEFFHLIKKIDRCRLLRPWIKEFMGYYLKDVFSSNNWVIDLSSIQTVGGRKINGKHNKSRKTHYCPKMIVRSMETNLTIGCSVNDV